MIRKTIIIHENHPVGKASNSFIWYDHLETDVLTINIEEDVETGREIKRDTIREKQK